MKAIHIADPLLINPTNPITVNLIGAGGTGSHMVMALAKTHASLMALAIPACTCTCTMMTWSQSLTKAASCSRMPKLVCTNLWRSLTASTAFGVPTGKR
jgi:hypothetical protein